ncbi:MAG: alpha-N-arabinofuranosidase [Prevotella sp.]|nr:alpha-N-arabinofuranosidase [Prevotella sp.]
MCKKTMLLTVVMTLALVVNATERIFIYCPSEREGLHLARFVPAAAVDGSGTWQEVGQLCSSDYGQWGAEKRMFHPSVARAADGTWRLVFQVNDRAPLFAAAYSADLVTWRPQDYPLVSTRQCVNPVIFSNDNGTFDIYFKTKGGDKRYVSASSDFRRFSKDEASQIGNDAWLRDTATIGGQLREGSLFDVSDDELRHITNHFDKMKDDAQLSSERMYEDAKNFPFLYAGGKPQGTIPATLTVGQQEKVISDKLIGVFFEDISYAADGGLYAELIQNRDFEYSSRDHRGWKATTAWHSSNTIPVVSVDPLSANNPHYAVLGTDTIYNEGWDGICLHPGENYDFSMFVRLVDGGKKQFKVALVDERGRVVAEEKLIAKGEGWQQLNAQLSVRHNQTGVDSCQLRLIGLKDVKAGIDMVSLFPQQTFMNRKNGLRRDLAETIAALKPKFVRFPGGCMSHGQGLENIYHWQETIGPLQDRKPDFNIWNYHQTRGLGFFEYFQFCEDIGAEPLPVLAAGVPCQNSAANRKGVGGQQGGIPMADMPAYIQELLNLIEWANGDPQTSKWARMRADAGHPAPFNLKYIGIGNEDIISTVFEERYEMICKTIREKYPDIMICGTVGPFHTPSADYIEGWDFTKKHPDLQYMVDEHYYESTGWFMQHQDYYDNYERDGVKVYLGEYAASTSARRPNVETALAEALYLCNVERNGDVVEMTSYAPMLAKDGHHNWNPDMIYFSNSEVRPTPAYETQRLFSVYGGDRYVKTKLKLDHPQRSRISHRVAASLVRDTKTGRRYLKLVNALPVSLTVSLDGLTLPENATAEGFSGQPEQQQVESETSMMKRADSVEVPPYAFRVVAL